MPAERRRVADLLRGLLWCAVALPLAGGCGHHPTDVDWCLQGGTVIDGSGVSPRVADVAIHDGRIHSIGDCGALRAGRTIDATGLWVTPGFIDMHSHADLILLSTSAVQEQLLAAKVMQGVTTVVVGNCGLGVAPATPEAAVTLEAVNGWMTPQRSGGGRKKRAPEAFSIGRYLGRLERDGVVPNAATLLPHGPVRISAMGLAPGAPSAEQLEAMRAAVSQGLDDGAWGVSVGLIYPPGMFSATDELVSLAELVAERDALLTAHIRGSSELLLPATDEIIEIARRSGARVHHSHLEAVGERFWPGVPAVLAREDEARAQGLAMSHDVFLYTRAATMMAAIFPPWSLEGGVPRLIERLQDPQTRRRIASEIEDRIPEWPPWQEDGWPHNLVEAVGWGGILVASVRGEGTPLVGRSLADLARENSRTPFDFVADLMIAQGGQVGQSVDQISGRDDDVEVLLSIFAHPAAAVVSDAEDYGRGSPHPAHAGAFARALRINRERALLPPEQVVRKMTGYPAALLGFDDRGTLTPGAAADVVLLDPEAVTDRATWDDPRVPAVGIPWVWINGHAVVEEGRWRGGLHGQVLRSGRSSPSETQVP